MLVSEAPSNPPSSPFAIVYEVGSAKADETIVVPVETATAAPQATASPMGIVMLVVGLGAAGLVIRRK